MKEMICTLRFSWWVAPSVGMICLLIKAWICAYRIIGIEPNLDWGGEAEQRVLPNGLPSTGLRLNWNEARWGPRLFWLELVRVDWETISVTSREKAATDDVLGQA